MPIFSTASPGVQVTNPRRIGGRSSTTPKLSGFRLLTPGFWILFLHPPKLRRESGSSNQNAPFMEHVAHSRQGHGAGKSRAFPAASFGLPLPLARPNPRRNAECGTRNAEWTRNLSSPAFDARLAASVGRAKDKARIEQLLQQADLDKSKLENILQRHKLKLPTT